MTSTDRVDFLPDALRQEFAFIAARPRTSPRISAVVPSYNRRDLLRQCLVSLFAQDLPPESFEVIIVDNGSEDGTSDMLARLALRAPCGFKAIRLEPNRGRSISRNLGVALAGGELIAFTDSDCIATPGWLRACLEGMRSGIGIVQGRTLPDPDTKPRLFSHYIVTDHLDGSYSTSNLCYRRQTILQAGGFDPGCDYWEDTDLGWRVRQLGWQAVFVREALIYHQIIALSPWQWLTWPTHFQSMPAKAARYPAFRAHLFLGLWVNRYHALFDLALVSLLLAVLVHPAWLGLAIPYLLAFPKQHGLRGRLPPVKVALHIAWDGLAFLTLLVSSVRHWAVVL